MRIYRCTKRNCCCGRPVVIRDVGGRPVAIHLADYVRAVLANRAL